jgi:hypothetical protein
VFEKKIPIVWLEIGCVQNLLLNSWQNWVHMVAWFYAIRFADPKYCPVG